MITTLALALTITLTSGNTPLVCPVMGGPAKAGGTTVEYEGATYSFCCPGCDTAFAKDPDKYIKEQAKAGKTTGEFLFDPISNQRIKPDKAKASMDYNGIRYYFYSEDNLEAFKKDPKKMSATPEKESMTCAVMGSKIASYSKASGYMDYKNVRYYFCCASCTPAMAKDPDKYAGKDLQKPQAITLTN